MVAQPTDRGGDAIGSRADPPAIAMASSEPASSSKARVPVPKYTAIWSEAPSATVPAMEATANVPNTAAQVRRRAPTRARAKASRATTM